MGAAKHLLDHKLLNSLSPLCDLTPDMLTELSAKSRLEEIASGTTIFTIGERDHRTLYLIAGKLELTDASGRTTKLAANSKQARMPLNQEKPRTVTAVAIGKVTLLNIDTSLLEMLTNWGSNQSYEVSSIEVSEEEETDWMSRFLQSKVFLKLRAENIQAMMMRMEEVPVRANDVIIKQGDVDENYYIIAKGKAKVARRVTPDAPLMKLAVLSAGNGFGEEALIANSERNATVVMMEDGRLMRLSKKDFISLLIEPVLQYVTYDEAKAMDAADVVWLDVRKLDEFSRGSLPGAINTPVTELRLGLRKLNKLHKYIVFSDTDDRAAAAVFLLNQNGLDACVLKDGLAKVPKSAQQKQKSPAVEKNEVADNELITDVNKFQSNNIVKMRGDKEAAEKQRAQATELARKKAKEEVARLKAEVDASRKRAEQEAKLAAKKARTEAEKAMAEERAKEMAREQAKREEVLKRAEAEAARAKMAAVAKQNAENEIKRLKQEAARSRKESEEQARKIAQTAKKEAAAEIARLKAEVEVAKQHEIENAVHTAEAESARAQAAERELERFRQQADEMKAKAGEQARLAADEARAQAEAEIQRFRQEAEVARMQLEEQAQRVTDSARSEAEREAARARSAEEARLQAESELERLAAEVAQIRQEVKAQAQLASDNARTDEERDEAYIRVEELAEHQKQVEAIARHAEEDAERAHLADEARQRAESEIARREQETAEAARRAEEEAKRAQAAADEHRKLEQELAQLRAEAESQEAEAERQREEEAKAAEADELARKAAEEAEQAKINAEKMRQQAEEDIKRLKAQAEAARIQAEIEVKRSIAAARREVDTDDIKKKVMAKMQAKADLLAGPKGNSPSEVAQRTRAARAAREAREAGLEALTKDDSDDLDEFFASDVAGDSGSEANSASQKAQRMRAMRDKEIAELEAVDNITGNDNLIDPTEVMEVDLEEQKRHWDSDDHAWEAAVGHRKDPNIERYDGKLPEGIKQEEQQKPEAPTSKAGVASKQNKTAKNSDKDAGSPLFEVQDVNRTIRPQVAKPSGKPVRESSKGKLVIVSLVVIVAVCAGGWFYAQNESAPKELKRVVNKSTESLAELTDKSAESLIQLKEKIAETIQQISEGEAEGKAVSEEKMAELRERLKEMKAESEQAAKKLAKRRAAQKKNDATQARQAVVKPVETEPVEPFLTPPENNAPKARIVDDGSETETESNISAFEPEESNNTGDSAIVEEAAVAETVENLPVIDE